MVCWKYKNESVERKMIMKRFAVLNDWNDDVSENIRSNYKKCYGVDLKEYIPQKKDDFFDNWKKLIDVSFGVEWSNMQFDDIFINEFIDTFLSSNRNDDKLLNAVNRYEFYEADIWISAAYTIRYLQIGDRFKKPNLQKILTPLKDAKTKDKNIKDILFKDSKEQCFCCKFIDYLITNKGMLVFEDILRDNQDFSLKPLEGKDVTRWTWQAILQTERDIFYSKLIFETDYIRKKELLDNNRKNNNTEYFKQLRILDSKPKIEDLILYWRLTGGEIVRRFLPIFHIRDDFKMVFDMKWLKKLCSIESISWQIILIEIYKRISFDNSEINYPYWFNNRSVGSFGISEDFQALNDMYKDLYEKQLDKYKSLVEWHIKTIDCETKKINTNRKLLVEIMVYLYMSSDKNIQGELLEIIQNNAKSAFNDLQTPSISNLEETIKSFNYGELDIDDICTKIMFEDLKQRVNNKKESNNNILEKIRLHKNEESLTARYVLLQRLIMRILAQKYKLIK